MNKINSNPPSLSLDAYQNICNSYNDTPGKTDEKNKLIRSITARVTALALPILALMDSINYGIQTLANKISPEKYPFKASSQFTKHLGLTGKFLLTAIPAFFFPSYFFRKDKETEETKSTASNTATITPYQRRAFKNPRSQDVKPKPYIHKPAPRMNTINRTGPADTRTSSPQIARMNADLDKHAGDASFKELWNILLTKKDLIKSWRCDDQGNFTLELKDSLDFYMEDFPIDGRNSDLYQMGIYMGNKKNGILSVKGQINKEKKEINFTQGLEVRVKQGRFSIPTIKFDKDSCFTIQGKVGFGFASYTSNMSFDKASLKKSWRHGEVINGDEAAFLQRKYQAYAQAKKTPAGKAPRFFLRDLHASRV